jgi:hypothetical protein
MGQGVGQSLEGAALDQRVAALPLAAAVAEVGVGVAVVVVEGVRVEVQAACCCYPTATIPCNDCRPRSLGRHEDLQQV